MEPVRHRVDYAFTRTGWNCLVVDKTSTVPRGYFRNRLARPNSQACTRITVQPEVSALVPVSMGSNGAKKTVATRDPRAPTRAPRFARVKIKKIK